MADFDFSTLNSTDLEDLVCDLLNEQNRRSNIKITYKTFKVGKDQGIDFLWSTSSNTQEVVGQVKHYFNTGYKTLYKDLKNIEKNKVIALNPKRYIFATSVDLTTTQTKNIYNLFKPYIKDLGDVYGRKDLNRLLRDYEEISHRHFKLWFSASSVLQKLNRYIYTGKAGEFEENILKRKLRLYVKIDSFDIAREALKKNNILVLTGEPGIGKTSMAEILLYEYIKDDYELNYISNSIAEIDKLIIPGESKQIFYFDDFLGHTETEIAKAKASESYLLNIIMRIGWAKNKKLILTTRTFILDTALEESEKLRKIGLKSKENTIYLSGYTDEVKIALLKNHIEESGLAKSYKNVLKKKELINFIIDHPYFYPRSVEYITDKEHLIDILPNEYEEFIRNNFNKPDKIWRHAYEYQINDIERFFLNTILSFGSSVNEESLEKAFNNRIDYEVKYNNLKRPMNAFKKTYKHLLGGFLRFEWVEEGLPRHLTFINYSLQDFLIGYLKEDSMEVIRIAESARFAIQLSNRLFPLSLKRINIKLPHRLETRLLTEPESFVGWDQSVDVLTISMLILSYLDSTESRTVAFRLLFLVQSWDSLFPEANLMDVFKEHLKSNEQPEFVQLIRKLGIKVFQSILCWLYDWEATKNWEKLISKKFRLNLSDLFTENIYNYDWDGYFTETLNDMISQIITDLRNGNGFDALRVEYAKRDLMKVREEMNQLMIFPELKFDQFHLYESFG